MCRTLMLGLYAKVFDYRTKDVLLKVYKTLLRTFKYAANAAYLEIFLL